MRSLLVIAFLVAHAYAEPARCVVSGNDLTLYHAQVHPPGAEPFEVDVYHVPVLATLPARCGAPLALDIGGDIRFSAQREQVWLSVKRDITSRDGLVTLTKGSRVIDACSKDGKVFASAVMYSDDVLEGERKPASEAVRDVEIPCDALTLESVESDDKTARTDDDADMPPRYEYQGEATRLALHTKPSDTSATHVIVADSFGVFTQLKRKGDWIFVEDEGEGVSVRGWIRRTVLHRVPDDMGVGRSYGCWGDHDGDTTFGFGFAAGVDKKGTVRVGTTLYRGEGTDPWGVFTTDAPVTVHIIPGEKWATVIDTASMKGWIGHVSLDAVKLDPTP